MVVQNWRCVSKGERRRGIMSREKNLLLGRVKKLASRGREGA